MSVTGISTELSPSFKDSAEDTSIGVLGDRLADSSGHEVVSRGGLTICAVSTFIGVFFFAGLLTGLPAVAEQTDETIQRGQNVFMTNKCSRCHSIEGNGGRMGPDLSHVGSRREAAWLQTFLKDPRSVIPQGKQPPFKGTDQEREELVMYLSSLR